MKSTVQIDGDKFMPWYYAINWVIPLLEQHKQQCEALGISSVMHEEKLEALEDLRQFLSMSWDMWLGVKPVAAQEVEQ